MVDRYERGGTESLREVWSQLRPTWELFSDGELQAFLANLVVDAAYRGSGIGRRLVTESLRQAGGERVDLLSEDDATGFYRTFAHFEKPGFRIYPFHQAD